MHDASPGVPAATGPPWRVRSRTCAGIDALVVGVGVAFFVIVIVDSVLTWPSNWVLLSSSSLGTLALILLVPTWIWVLASMFFVARARRPTTDNWYRRAAASPVVRTFGALFLLLLVVAVIGAAIGWASGSLRVLPGGRHQVSTGGLDHSAWTTVSAHAYRVWDARFVREDVLIGVLALAMVALALSYLRLHRTTATSR